MLQGKTGGRAHSILGNTASVGVQTMSHKFNITKKKPSKVTYNNKALTFLVIGHRVFKTLTSCWPLLAQRKQT